MSRLPTPGGDNGNWGAILNDYLSQEHNADGSLKIRTEGIPATIADGSITASKLSSSLNSYIANAQTAVQSVNGKTGQAVTLTASDIADVVADSEKGAANGVATLDGTSKLTSAQLPSSVASSSQTAPVIGMSEQLSSYVWSGNSVQTVLGVAFTAPSSGAVEIDCLPPDITTTTAPATNSTVTVDLYDGVNSRVLRRQIVPIGGITTTTLPSLRRVIIGLPAGADGVVYWRVKLSFGSNSTTLNAGLTAPDENPMQLVVRRAAL